jgi:hypothetical protein
MTPADLIPDPPKNTKEKTQEASVPEEDKK